MNNAVLNELGDTSQQMYFKCPSDDNLSGLGLPADAAYPGATSLPLYQPDTTSDTAGGSGFDPFALQKLVSSDSSASDNQYTYRNPPGSVMGPPAPTQTVMTPWGPITPINQIGGGGGFNPYALQTLATPVPGAAGAGGGSSNWQSTLLKTLDATVKAGAPAATAYINYTAAQNALRNQPVQVPGGRPGVTGKTNYTPWIIGGLAIAGLLVALTVFSAKR